MFYSLERFEGLYAVLISDNKETVNILKTELKGAKIGDIFKEENGRFILEREMTQKRKNDAISLHRSIFGKLK